MNWRKYEPAGNPPGPHPVVTPPAPGTAANVCCPALTLTDSTPEGPGRADPPALWSGRPGRSRRPWGKPPALHDPSALGSRRSCRTDRPRGSCRPCCPCRPGRPYWTGRPLRPWWSSGPRGPCRPCRPCRPRLTPLDGRLARIALGGRLDNPRLTVRRTLTGMNDAACIRDAGAGDPGGHRETETGRTTKNDERPAPECGEESHLPSSFAWEGRLALPSDRPRRGVTIPSRNRARSQSAADSPRSTGLGSARARCGPVRSPAAPALVFASAAEARTIHVRSDAQFASAERTLSRSGGKIVLHAHLYRKLVVKPRSRRLLRIVGTRGARVQQPDLRRDRSASRSGGVPGRADHRQRARAGTTLPRHPPARPLRERAANAVLRLRSSIARRAAV